ncbi:MAG: glycosyltransferase family 4 protein [Candidatus Omnitrophica bacterium]|nr:glycosyltransferase family 4 protein [Candidatus Omnitrophota bacterium]
MKICHLVGALNVGGLEKTLIAVSCGLQEHEHHIWCLREKGSLAAEIEDAGVPLRAFHFCGRLRVSAVNRLASAVKSEGFDIIHCHGLIPCIWGGVVVQLIRGIVCIFHCQNVYWDLSWKERLKFRFFSGFASRVIAVSEAVKASLVERVGIPPEKVTVIYNSAPRCAACAAKERSGLRREFGWDEKDFLIGSVGRLQDHKGHRFLVEAVARLRRKHPFIRCLIAGEGPERENLQAQIDHCLLHESVKLAGCRFDVSRIMRALDVCVQPTLRREGLPLALAEAAACGVPLIATRTGGNAEIVHDGHNGFLFDEKDVECLAERLNYCLKNPRERMNMGAHARRIWEEKFTRARMLERIGELYRVYE